MDNRFNTDTSGGPYSTFLTTPMPKVGLADLSKTPIGERSLISGRGDQFNTSFKAAYDSYDSYVHGANYKLGGLDEMRAQNQGGWERTGRSFAQLGGTILGQVIAGSGSILKLLGNPIDTGQMLYGDTSAENYEDTKNGIIGSFGHMLETSGIAIQKGIEEAMPIYQTQVAQEGGWGKFGDSSWWAAMFPTVGSAMASFVPVLGAMKGLNVAAGLLREAGAITGIGRGIGLAKGLATVGKAFQTSNVAQVLTGTMFSTHLDVMQEIANQYDSELKYGKEQLGMNDKEALDYASNWAASSYRKGVMATSVFELGQMKVLLGSGKFMTSMATANAKKATKQYLKTIFTKGVAAADAEIGAIAAKTIKKTFVKEAFNLGSVALGEGFQEMGVDVALAEGKREAKMNAGFEDFSPTAIGDRLSDFASKGKNWDSFIWGAFGGMLMTGGRSAIDSILYKDTANKELDIIKNHLDTLSNLTKGLASYDSTASTVDQHGNNFKLLLPLIHNSIKNGTFDVTNKFIADMSKLNGISDTELKVLGFTIDSIEGAKVIKTELERASKIYQEAFKKKFSEDDTENKITQINYAHSKHSFEYWNDFDKKYADLIAERRIELSKQITDLNKDYSANEILKDHTKFEIDDIQVQIDGMTSARNQAQTNLSNAQSERLDLVDQIKRVKDKFTDNAVTNNNLVNVSDFEAIRVNARISNFRHLATLELALKALEGEVYNQTTLRNGLDKSIADSKSKKVLKATELAALRVQIASLKITIESTTKDVELSKKPELSTVTDIELNRLMLERAVIAKQTAENVTKLKIYDDPIKLAEYLAKQKEFRDIATATYLTDLKNQMVNALTSLNIDTIVKEAKDAGLDLSKEGIARKKQIVINNNNNRVVPPVIKPIINNKLTDSIGTPYTISPTSDILTVGIHNGTIISIGDTIIPYNSAQPKLKGTPLVVTKFSKSTSGGSISISVHTENNVFRPDDLIKEGEVNPLTVQSPEGIVAVQILENTVLKAESEFEKGLSESTVKDIQFLFSDVAFQDEMIKIFSETDALRKKDLLTRLFKVSSKIDNTVIINEEAYTKYIANRDSLKFTVGPVIEQYLAVISLDAKLTDIFRWDTNTMTDGIAKSLYVSFKAGVLKQLASSWKYGTSPNNKHGRFINYNPESGVMNVSFDARIQSEINTLTDYINQGYNDTTDTKGNVIASTMTAESMGQLTALLDEYIVIKNKLTALTKILLRETIGKDNIYIENTFNTYIETLKLDYDKLIAEADNKADKTKLSQEYDTVKKELIKLKNLSKSLSDSSANTLTAQGQFQAGSITDLNTIFDNINTLLGKELKDTAAYGNINIIVDGINKGYSVFNNVNNLNNNGIEGLYFTRLKFALQGLRSIRSNPEYDEVETIESSNNSEILDDSILRDIIMNYSESLSDKTAVSYFTDSLKNTYFAEAEVSISVLQDLINTYKTFHLHTQDDVPITFDNILTVLRGKNKIDADFQNQVMIVYDSIRHIQELFLNKSMLTYMAKQVSMMDIEDADYYAMKSTLDALTTLSKNLVKVPTRDDYSPMSKEYTNYFTEKGDLKWAYVQKWLDSYEGGRVDYEYKPGITLETIYGKAISELNESFDVVTDMYKVNTVEIEGVSFTVSEVYQAVAQLSLNSEIHIDTTGIDMKDTSASLNAYIIINNKRFVIGRIKPSELRIGEKIVDGTVVSNGIALTIIDPKTGTTTFSNYLTSTKLKSITDMIAVKTLLNPIKEFYKVYTVNRQSNKHNEVKYLKLLEDIKNARTTNPIGETFYNWLLTATGDIDIVNPHKAYTVLSTIFYRIEDNLVDSYKPNGIEIYNKFRAYEESLLNNFNKGNILKQRIADTITPNNQIELKISHLGSPSPNFSDKYSEANKVNDVIKPNTMINGQPDVMIVHTMNVEQEHVISNLSNDTTIPMSVDDMNALLAKDAYVYAQIAYYGSQPSYIPLRSATLNTFGKKSTASYNDHARDFLIIKMMELLNNTVMELPNTKGTPSGNYQMEGGYTSNDVLDDLKEITIISQSINRSIAAAALAGDTVWFKFHKVYKDANGTTHKIEFRTVDAKGVVKFYKLEKIVRSDGTIEYSLRTVGTKFANTVKGKKRIANTRFNSKGEIRTKWSDNLLSSKHTTNVGAVNVELILKEKLKGIVGDMTRNLPVMDGASNKIYDIRSHGRSVGKNLNIMDENNPAIPYDLSKSYTSVVTGETYKHFQDFLLSTGAVYSNIQAIRDKNGNIVSNYTLQGKIPAKINIDFEVVKKVESVLDVLNNIKANTLLESILTNNNGISTKLGLDNNALMKQFLEEIKVDGDVSYKHFSTYKAYTEYFKRTYPNSEVPTKDDMQKVLAKYTSSNRNIATFWGLSQQTDTRVRAEIFHELLHSFIKTKLTTASLVDKAKAQINEYVTQLKIAVKDSTILSENEINLLNDWFTKIEGSNKTSYEELITYGITEANIARILNKLLVANPTTTNETWLTKFIDMLLNLLHGLSIIQGSQLSELKGLISNILLKESVNTNESSKPNNPEILDMEFDESINLSNDSIILEDELPSSPVEMDFSDYGNATTNLEMSNYITTFNDNYTDSNNLKIC